MRTASHMYPQPTYDRHADSGLRPNHDERKPVPAPLFPAGDAAAGAAARPKHTRIPHVSVRDVYPWSRSSCSTTRTPPSERGGPRVYAEAALCQGGAWKVPRSVDVMLSTFLRPDRLWPDATAFHEPCQARTSLQLVV